MQSSKLQEMISVGAKLEFKLSKLHTHYLHGKLSIYNWMLLQRQQRHECKGILCSVIVRQF